MPKTPATLPGVHTRKQRTKPQIKKEKHITKKKSTYKQQMKERKKHITKKKSIQKQQMTKIGKKRISE